MMNTAYYPRAPDISKEKRKLIWWFVQWLKKDNKTGNIEFDLPELIIIMQSFGFKIENFEKFDTAHNSQNTVSVELTCGQSGIRCTMTKEATCKCPPNEDASQFWTDFARVPSGHGNVSSLLPRISIANSETIMSILSGALFSTYSATDARQKNMPSSNSTFLVRSFSLDNFETPPSNQKGIKRQHSWEVDPKTSPPTQTSSPLPSLCASMSKISVSSESHNSLAQNLKSIETLVQESIELALVCKSSTFTKEKYKRVSDIKPGEEVKQRVMTPEKKFVTPRRMVTPKKYKQPSERKNVVTAGQNSKMVVQKSKIVLKGKVSPAFKRKIREDTPMLGVSKNLTPNINANEKATKSKIASYVGLTPKSIYRVAKTSESEANSSNSSARFKNVVKATSSGANCKPK